MSKLNFNKTHGGMKRKKVISKTSAYTILTILSICWILPLIWLIFQSFGTDPNMDYGSTFGSPDILPSHYTIDWYVKLFTETEFGTWYLNTLIIALVCMVLSTFFTLSMAYVMSRFRFKSRKLIQNVGLILGMFPGFMSMVAIYYIFKGVGLAGDVASWKQILALILVYSGGAGLNYYVSKGFFDTVSKSLDEAARIDGATNSQVFTRIILPLSKPIIVYTALMSFTAPWGDFIFASYILKENSSAYTVAVGLYRWIAMAEIPAQWYNLFAAGAVCVAVPITILFLCLQKYFVEGITGGAVKG